MYVSHVIISRGGGKGKGSLIQDTQVLGTLMCRGTNGFPPSASFLCPKTLPDKRYIFVPSRFLSWAPTRYCLHESRVSAAFLSAASSFAAPLPYKAPTMASEHRKTAAFHLLRASVTSRCSASGVGGDDDAGGGKPPLLLSEPKREPSAQLRSFPGRPNRRGPPCFAAGTRGGNGKLGEGRHRFWRSGVDLAEACLAVGRSHNNDAINTQRRCSHQKKVR